MYGRIRKPDKRPALNVCSKKDPMCEPFVKSARKVRAVLINMPEILNEGCGAGAAPSTQQRFGPGSIFCFHKYANLLVSGNNCVFPNLFSPIYFYFRFETFRNKTGNKLRWQFGAVVRFPYWWSLCCPGPSSARDYLAPRTHR